MLKNWDQQIGLNTLTPKVSQIFKHWLYRNIWTVSIEKKDKNQDFSFCSDKVFSNFGLKHIWNSNSMLSYYFLIFVDINKPTGHRIIKCLRTRSFILNLFPKLSHSFDHPLDSPIDSELTNHGFFHNFCWGLCSHLSLVLLCKNWQIVGCQRQSQIGVKIPTFTSITFSLWY